jgi:ornithine cyclodeaminase
VHARPHSDCGSRGLSTTGARWHTHAVAGVQISLAEAGQFSAALLLFDLATHTPLAVLDSNEITRLRTAAITAMVAAHAAAPAARKFALFGAGVQGRAQAAALCERFDFEEICIVDPQADPAWCERFQAGVKGQVRLAAPEEAVRGAAIVVTATCSLRPVFHGGWLSPGALASAVGTCTPQGRELDDATMSRAARIIVEWKPQSLTQAGEIVLWPGHRNAYNIVDLPELLRDAQTWRTDEHGITVFKSVGVGLSDVAAAHLALQRARDGSLRMKACPATALQAT